MRGGRTRGRGRSKEERPSGFLSSGPSNENICIRRDSFLSLGPPLGASRLAPRVLFHLPRPNAIDLRPNASTSSHDQSTWSRSRYAPPGTSPPGALITPAAASISASVRVGAGSTPTETSYGRDATGLRRERGVASSNPEGGLHESSSFLFCVVKNRPTFATARVSDAFFSSSFNAAGSSRTRGAARILASTRRRASSLE